MIGTTVLFLQHSNNSAKSNPERRRSIEETRSENGIYTNGSLESSKTTTAENGGCSNLAFRYWTYVVERPMLFCIIVYITFIAIGVVFFATFFGWNFGTAFYLAMGTGLNIGPCQPSLQPPTAVKIFTVFYILLSSCVISGVVGFALSTLTYTKVDLFSGIHSDASMYQVNPDNSLSITALSLAKYIWIKIKYYSGWYTSRTRTICVIIALGWLSFGVLYGIYGLGYDFITSLYWALGTASTAGFYAPECINGTSGEQCDMGNVR